MNERQRASRDGQTGSAEIRVMTIDEQAVVRAGLRAFLGGAPDMNLVAEAADGVGGLEIALRSRPDVVLTEARLPGLDGAELTRRLRAEPGGPPPRVIILTALDLDRYVLDCLRAGASGFLLKRAAPAEVLSGIRAVAGGEVAMAPAVTRRLVERLLDTLGPADPARAATLDALTTREQEVLELVARGLSNVDIAARLFMSVGTVKAHVSRVLTKLGLRDRVQAVILAYECGLVRPTPSR